MAQNRQTSDNDATVIKEIVTILKEISSKISDINDKKADSVSEFKSSIGKREMDYYRNLNVIQDFNNKKANSHATIFAASVFALFTVLSLSTRIVTPGVFDPSNVIIFIFSSVSYFLIIFLGGYSSMNFTYYSTISQRAEELIVEGLERQLITEEMKKWKNPLKRFASFKVPPNEQGWTRRNLQTLILIGYSVIGILPFVAFVIWFFRII
jgi:hypothetical protein